MLPVHEKYPFEKKAWQKNPGSVAGEQRAVG
jgi:hypothetical protein